jgi:hypothetical protein
MIPTEELTGANHRRRASIPSERTRSRPAAAAQPDERVKDYQQLSVRLPGDVKERLRAMSRIGGRPQWRILCEAIDCYFRERPAGERRLVDAIVGRARDRSCP